MKKVALVTGSSRGIGKAIALRLAKEGMDVVVNYLKNEDKAKETAKQIENLGAKTIFVKADVSKFADVERMVSRVLQEFQKIDILVNNAGIYVRKTIWELGPRDWQRTIDINLTGVYNCCKAVIPQMKNLGWGRIVNISSQIGFKGSTHGADYSASKAGVVGLTKSLALELARYNITVNAISPGAVDTDILAGDTEEERQRRREAIPLGRIGVPEEIAAATAFLVSEDANYITGQTLHVNGGYLMV